jgi:hypothetical protein
VDLLLAVGHGSSDHDHPSITIETDDCRQTVEELKLRERCGGATGRGGLR